MNESEEQLKIRILFVCHGNICRSPMAEFLLRRMADRVGVGEYIEVSSAAISDEEVGNPVYPLAKRMLATHGIGCRDKVACRLTQSMFDESDYVVAMDTQNLVGIERMVNVGKANVLCRLLDFVATDNDIPRDIADPWYTRNFEKAWADISVGCDALLRHLIMKYNLVAKEG